MKKAILFLMCAAAYAQVSTPTNAKDATISDGVARPWIETSTTWRSAFEIWNNNKLVLRIGMDGKIELGENVKPDEAAKRFWEELKKAAPAVFNAGCRDGLFGMEVDVNTEKVKK